MKISLSRKKVEVPRWRMDSVHRKHKETHHSDRHLDLFILKALREAGSVGVSGAELAQRLGVTRAAIWARVETLRELGFEIDAHPHHGYRLISSPDVLLADDLLSRLDNVRLIGREIYVFKETTSTNDVADHLAHSGAKEGTIVIAESQTKGRGRLGRSWFSPPKSGIWLSVILRPSLSPHQVTQLTLMAAVATRNAIHQAVGLAPTIKWPNDIVVSGKKLGGILTEMAAEQDRILHVVLGIGLNANIPSDKFPQELRRVATSLQIELGRPVHRPAVAAELIRELDKWYETLRQNHFTRIIEEWQKHCSTVGRFVRIKVGTRTIRGLAESVDIDGALLVRTSNGQLERVTGGDVTLEKDSD